MKIKNQQDYNGAAQLLTQHPQVMQDVVAAAGTITTAANCKSITDAFIGAMVSGRHVWTKEYTGFTSYTLPGAGRPAGIDLYSATERVAIELELSNQTAMSHDLLKLLTCQKNGNCDLGLLITIERDVPAAFGYKKSSSASLHFATAKRWLDVFAVVFTMPITLISLEK